MALIGRAGWPQHMHMEVYVTHEALCSTSDGNWGLRHCPFFSPLVADMLLGVSKAPSRRVPMASLLKVFFSPGFWLVDSRPPQELGWILMRRGIFASCIPFFFYLQITNLEETVRCEKCRAGSGLPSQGGPCQGGRHPAGHVLLWYDSCTSPKRGSKPWHSSESSACVKFKILPNVHRQRDIVHTICVSQFTTLQMRQVWLCGRPSLASSPTSHLHSPSGPSD